MHSAKHHHQAQVGKASVRCRERVRMAVVLRGSVCRWLRLDSTWTVVGEGAWLGDRAKNAYSKQKHASDTPRGAKAPDAPAAHQRQALELMSGSSPAAGAAAIGTVIAV
jgi:hypothetical protein